MYSLSILWIHLDPESAYVVSIWCLQLCKLLKCSCMFWKCLGIQKLSLSLPWVSRAKLIYIKIKWSFWYLAFLLRLCLCWFIMAVGKRIPGLSFWLKDFEVKAVYSKTHNIWMFLKKAQNSKEISTLHQISGYIHKPLVHLFNNKYFLGTCYVLRNCFRCWKHRKEQNRQKSIFLMGLSYWC